MKNSKIISARKCCLGGLLVLAFVLSLLAPRAAVADGSGGQTFPSPQDSVYQGSVGSDTTSYTTDATNEGGTGNIWWLIDLVL
jgi:hypothetical protein